MYPEFILAINLNHASIQLIDCSSVIPKPPALKDVIQFPPQTFLVDIDQSVSLPWSFSLPLQLFTSPA